MEQARSLIVCCLCLLPTYVETMTVLSLNGVWTVSNGLNVTGIPGKVPGSMYTALMDNNIIGDPYYRKNDLNYRWIGLQNWTYTRKFTVNNTIKRQRSVVLVCNGLDTIAKVKVNNMTVGESDNMFIRYSFDIKSALMTGTNIIELSFMSAVHYARKRAQVYPYRVPPVSISSGQHGENHVNMIRKEQCSFSWDWGPSFATQGIWKDIYIQAYNSAVIRDVTSETIKKNDLWVLVVEVFLEVTPHTRIKGQMEAVLMNTGVTKTKHVSVTQRFNKVHMNISVPASEKIGLWWPNGHGNQTLYDLQVTFTDAIGRMSSKKIRIGFRTIELVQDYVYDNNKKQDGRHFYFRINDRPIFFKGTNWIPADSFLERVTKDRLYNYLQSVADVHMNVMRVWGGGVYESDEFYEICDELGIMIWQDFMFACAMYPTDEQFLKSVSQEVTYQVRRMKHHPSIVVLSGNNENEKALVQNWYGTSANFSLYKSDYIKLYIDVIYAIVKQEDTSRPFLSSSPSNGIETELEGWVARNPGDTRYGDIHEYIYLAPFYDPAQYRIPRFSSEYGLQSYPSYESLVPVYKKSDMDYWGDLNEHRNHHPYGNTEMMTEAELYLKLPKNGTKKQMFIDLIYLTQIDQAIGMRTETEHLRRWQNRINYGGQGYTMGALYWMLADIWQAPTWASLEYGGKWKMLHYYAQHFFAPTLISPYLDGNDLDIYLIFDEGPIEEVQHPSTNNLYFQPKSNPTPFNVFDLSSYGNQPQVSLSSSESAPAYMTKTSDFAGTLYIELFLWSSLKPQKIWTVPFEINSTAESIFRRNIDDMISEAGGVSRSRCFLYLHLGDKVNGPTSWFALTTIKDANGLTKANIQITEITVKQKQGEFNIQLETNAVAPFVWLEAYGVKGRFSDNGFLLATTNINITFYAWETVALEQLYDVLTVKSLIDIY